MRATSRILPLIAAAALFVGMPGNAKAALVLGVGAGGDTLANGGLGDFILGEAIPEPGGSAFAGLDARSIEIINQIIGMAPGTRTPTGQNPEYYRSTTSFGTLPLAVTGGHVEAGSIGAMSALAQYISIQLPATTTYKYLVGAYDGPNGGAQVWFIGNVAAGTEIQIPRFAQPSPASSGNPKGENDWPQNLVQDEGTYQITTWTMYNPTDAPPGGPPVVPEPSTVIAGALLLLPFGIQGLKRLRNRKS